MIDQYGKGLIPHPEGDSAVGAMLIGSVAAPQYDFSVPSGLPTPPDSDQGSSQSCTCHAFGKHFWAWTGIDLCKQDMYSRIHLPGGGAYLVAPYDKMSDSGCYDLTQHADPNPQTEANMVVTVNVPGQKRRMFKVRRWGVQYNDISAVATAMKQWKGIVIGLNGNNPDWVNGTDPHPPGPGHPAEWGHALYCYDNKMLDQRALVAASSWCNWVKYHNLRENYFTTNNVFSPIAMEVQELIMNEQILVINYKGKVGLMFVGGLSGNILFAVDVPHLVKLGEVYGHTILHHTNAEGIEVVDNIDVVIN